MNGEEGIPDVEITRYIKDLILLTILLQGEYPDYIMEVIGGRRPINLRYSHFGIEVIEDSVDIRRCDVQPQHTNVQPKLLEVGVFLVQQKEKVGNREEERLNSYILQLAAYPHQKC